MLYELKSEDLSGLGGPMGTERTSTNFVKVFDGLRAAKSFAEKDYNQSRGPITWISQGKNQWRSQDLGYVMYYIRPVKINK